MTVREVFNERKGMRKTYLFGALGRGFKTALLVTSIFTYYNKEKIVFNNSKLQTSAQIRIK